MKLLAPLIGTMAACAATPTTNIEPAGELSSNAKADGETWCHANLASTGGTQAVFDYQVVQTVGQGPQQDISGQNVWLNVQNSSFSEHDKPRAVVVVFEYPGPCADDCQNDGSQIDTKQIDLDYQDGRFTAPIPKLPIFFVPEDTDGSDTTAYFWELAIENDNTWYKDPSTGNNLRFSPAAIEGFCAQGHSL